MVVFIEGEDVLNNLVQTGYQKPNQIRLETVLPVYCLPDPVILVAFASCDDQTVGSVAHACTDTRGDDELITT